MVNVRLHVFKPPKRCAPMFVRSGGFSRETSDTHGHHERLSKMIMLMLRENRTHVLGLTFLTLIRLLELVRLLIVISAYCNISKI